MFEHLGIAPAEILLPNCNLSKWSVIACDQYTAQADYWRRVDEIVGDAPSSLRLILPEANLQKETLSHSIERINAAMEAYLDQELFYTCKDAMIYVEREVGGGRKRRGLVCKVDLEEYDYHKGSRSMIRATEETVAERIPARVQIRENAPLELPHGMILLDDTARDVFAPITARKEELEKLYGFTLMEGGGRIDGWRLDAAALERLAQDLQYLRTCTELLFAVGDGNHSLAAAKAIYERDKAKTPECDWEKLPSRWALAEIVSLNDPGVVFLPIHRIVFGVDPLDLLEAFGAYYPNALPGETAGGHTIRWRFRDGSGSFTVPTPPWSLEVETLQAFLDDYIRRCGGSMDYIHDLSAVEEMSRQTRTIGFILPEFSRAALFPYVKARGALPRKTFSIGRSRDKRYYLEARAIKE